VSSENGYRSYYGQPVLKEPVWTPEIPLYFFTGGLAGASAGLAYLAELRRNRELARRSWAVALGAVSVSPALLVSDLGVPSRFLNMLRMFKVTSPMSVGSWILSASGMATGLAAANAWTGAFPRSSRFARPAAAALGLPLSTYTAALLANTAIPAWHEARATLPFGFAGGAAASAGAVAVALTPPRRAAPARRLAIAGAATEIAASELMVRRLGDLGEPYHQGTAGRLYKVALGLSAAGAALIVARGARSRPAAVAGGALLGAGALAERWSVFKAGFESAADPKYVVGQQRRRIERGEPRGRAVRQESRAAAS
jgi:formate-dependent nitrite reductase membrane component NrfD